MENNQTFREMFLAAQGMLSGKDPERIARNAGVLFDGACFQIPSLGTTYHFSYPDYRCQEPILQWHCLTILHYLNLADGSPVTGEPIAMADMPAGLIRGTKCDRTIAQMLADFLTEKTDTQTEASFRILGGQVIQGKADLNLMLPFLPRFPLYVNIWFADEEFPPSARLFADRCAGHYLTIEDAVTVADVVLQLLQEVSQQHSTGFAPSKGSLV